MRFFMKLSFAAVALVFATASAQGPTQFNPHTQIRWPDLVGMGTPTSLSCTSTNYGEPYTDKSVTPNVHYHCGTTGWAVDASGGGGAVSSVNGQTGTVTLPMLASSASVVLAGDSRLLVSGTCQNINNGGPCYQGTITAGVIASGVATFTASNSQSAGNILTLSGFSGSAAGLNGQVVTVLSSGLSNSQFEADVTGITTLASTGAGAWICRNTVQGQIAALPLVVSSGATVINTAVPDQTVAGIVSGYTATLHPLSPAVTGNPAYLIIQDDFDAVNGSTFATIEGLYSTLWADAWADGYKIVQTTQIPYGNSIYGDPDATAAAVNEWMKGQIGTINSHPGSILVDTASVLSQVYDSTFFLVYGVTTGQDDLHFNDAGASMFTALVNAGLSSGGNVLFSAGAQTVAMPVTKAGESIGSQIIDTGGGYSGWNSLSWELYSVTGPSTYLPLPDVGVFWIDNTWAFSLDLNTINGYPQMVLNPYGSYCWINGSNSRVANPGATCFSADQSANDTIDLDSSNNYSAAPYNNKLGSLKLNNLFVGGTCTGCGGGSGNAYSGVNTQTGTSYTLLLSDAGGYVRMNNAASNTVTIPPSSSVAFTAGTVIVFNQVGAGQTTLAPGAGVTLNTPTSLSTRAQFSTISITYVGSDVWDVAGDLQ